MKNMSTQFVTFVFLVHFMPSITFCSSDKIVYSLPSSVFVKFFCFFQVVFILSLTLGHMAFRLGLNLGHIIPRLGLDLH
jgi:hypothetical protein